MKRLFIFVALMAFVGACVTPVHAEPLLNKRNVWRAKQKFDHGIEVDNTATFNNAVTLAGTTTVSGSIADTTGGVTATEIADVVRYVQLPLASFITVGVPVTNATAPGIEVDDLVPGIVWADGEVTPALISFRVPSDYSSGGAFKVFATESDSTTPNQVDFSVYVNSDGIAADSAATNQTPVALDGVTSTGTEITLTVATDFASLSAGNWVTLNIWRDDVAAGTGDLEVKGVAFYYTAVQ